MQWCDDVSQTLTFYGIEHSICENGSGILINRDSIIKNTIGRSEQEHYDRLIVRLKFIYSYRFFYGSKTDDWLLLQIII